MNSRSRLLCEFAVTAAAIRATVLLIVERERPGEFAALMRLVDRGWRYKTVADEGDGSCSVSVVAVAPDGEQRTIAEFVVDRAKDGARRLQ